VTADYACSAQHSTSARKPSERQSIDATMGPGASADARLRIAYALDGLGIGGTELNALRSARLLRARGASVALYHLQATGPLLERFRESGIVTHHIPISGLATPGALSAVRELSMALRRAQVHVLHAHDVYSNLVAVVAARLVSVPLVIASRRWLTTVPRPGLLRANRHVSYRLAHRVLANSPRIARYLTCHDGVPEAKVVVVPNFVDDDALEPLPESARLLGRRRLRIPDGRLLVGCLARLSPEKDHALLIDGFALIAEHLNLHLAIVGDGPERPALERRVAEAGLGERVTFAGAVAHEIRAQSLFDIAVLTSRDEAFPNSIVEAMAAGLPVVATDVGGVSDAVTDGETGLLVKRRTAADVAAALTLLANEPHLRRALGERGRLEASRRFSASATIALLEDLYSAGLRRQPQWG
jgi:glycosyltransferase involved in cell wall biosynthesis